MVIRGAATISPTSGNIDKDNEGVERALCPSNKREVTLRKEALEDERRRDTRAKSANGHLCRDFPPLAALSRSRLWPHNENNAVGLPTGRTKGIPPQNHRHHRRCRSPRTSRVSGRLRRALIGDEERPAAPEWTNSPPSVRSRSGIPARAEAEELEGAKQQLCCCAHYIVLN
ncbi:hypothetical protein KM043_002753 [Ampulex compressa]|nr:hypothetical protein KM043_002753 [Ampulex compressa]